MSDAAFRTFNLVFQSRGISARYVDDAVPESVFLNLNSVEEIEENALASRLGTQIVNRTGTAINALSGSVHTVNKLAGLGGSAWRYAGAGANLYRRAGLTQGVYSVISTTMSGLPWQGVVYRPEASSYPYLFVADLAGMLKDNGTLPAPQQWGIFQPQYPVVAQAQNPVQIVLDDYTGLSTGYSYTGIAGGTIAGNVSTVTTSPVASVGIRKVDVASPEQVGLFQLLTVDTGGNAEEVLVLFKTSTGFIAAFTKTHASGSSVSNQELSVVVPASTTATVSKIFSGTPIGAWPTTLQQADYIGLWLFVSDPTQIKSITLKFDCGDGSFQTDFFYRVIAQGPLQSLLDPLTDPTVASSDAIISRSLDIYGSSQSSVSALNSGINQWTPLLLQLSDFAGSGRANFTDPNFNWEAVNGYQVEIVTNETSSATVALSSLVIFGGAGPDSFAGVGYDYLVTFYNKVDGTESNPCMVMTNINPPLDTNWVVPRRQPVLLTITHPVLDPQTTNLRVYRRGGTLGDNYRRIDEIPCTGATTQYTDLSSDDDIKQGDLISFVNDVPVTATLPVPVNTTLAGAIATTNQVVTVTPVSMANISVRQQIIIGNIAPVGLLDTSEIVIVLSVTPTNFTAFVQNTHQSGEMVTATAKYGQPVNIICEAYSQMYFAGDENNPHYLYYSSPANPQAVGSANYVEVGTPDDPITVIAKIKGNLYVSTRKFWWAIAPGTTAGAPPTVYPTAAKHGCVAPLGYIVTEEGIFYQAIDGIRFFAGGASIYLTQDQEFIFQDVGNTPIVEADQNQLSQTRSAYWNNMLFFSYAGVDGHRHRLIYHAIYKRWRNDDVDAQSIFLEADTNTLVYGTGDGLVKIDRIGTFDETASGGQLVNSPIPINLQLAYRDQGMPAETKVYQEFTLDCNTQGQDVNAVLMFNDGEFFQSIGTVNTSQRERFNVTLAGGQGIVAYKVSLVLTGLALSRIFIYQAAIRALQLAKTRKSLDTYYLRFSDDGSKICKNLFCEYTSTEEIFCMIAYDEASFPPFMFTLPASPGTRNPMRVRLPAVNFRWLRLTMVSGSDFQIWNNSRFEVKSLCQGKGYAFFDLMSVEN